ncbi:MAG: hypothetical protein H5U33_20425, partial [Pseudomonas sp.]|nr:hypothetical protein [Pseudomonas sp.]
MNKVLRITLAGEREVFADSDLAACIREAWKGKAKDILNAAEKEGVMVLQAD